MTDRDALTQLVQALDGYFAIKGTPEDRVWLDTFNALLRALAQAKQQIAEPS